jgi:uncharacterized membrane protein YfcA
MLEEFIYFVIVGFAAQMVDGALGMAYGVISTSVLVSLGISPMVASASVHTSEIVTTGISGISHAMFKNIDWLLFRRLVLPGILGSVVGAYTLTKIPENVSRPFIAIYFVIMGCVILYRILQDGKFIQSIKKFMVTRLQKRLPSKHARGLVPLGLAGGFLDATGGGGWGPIVSSSLLAQGATPHYTIGSVNATEFLIAISSSFTFFLTIGVVHWPIILGLIVGGALAAPLAAYFVRNIQPRIIMLIAGLVVILLGLYTIGRVFF